MGGQAMPTNWLCVQTNLIADRHPSPPPWPPFLDVLLVCAMILPTHSSRVVGCHVSFLGAQ